MAMFTCSWTPADARVSIERLETPFLRSSSSSSSSSKALAFVLHGVLTEEECANFIRASEEKGYELAKVNVGGGREEVMTDVRNSARCMIDDASSVEVIWQRILAVLGASESGGDVLQQLLTVPFANDPSLSAVGLNERMRYLRYDDGMFFAVHQDGSYVRSDEAGSARRGEQSFVTCQIYLNEGFEGGATRFIDAQDEFGAIGLDCVPRTGSILLFQHNLWHEGSLLRAGRKYTIRTDVMYSRKPDSTYAERPIYADPASSQTAAGDAFQTP